MIHSTHSARIPVTLITGFLGSGKTTLLNHLVKQPEFERTLVVINELGKISLDHLLVTQSTEDQVLELEGGCLCCTIRQDLVTTLKDITWRFSREGARQFDRLVIETTGLADPAPIIHTLMTHPAVASKYCLDGLITAVDLVNGSHTLDEHIEAVKQAAVADLILLTKADLASNDQKSALTQRLNQLNPGAKTHTVNFGVLHPDELLDLGIYKPESKPERVSEWLNEQAYHTQTFSPMVSGFTSSAAQAKSAEPPSENGDSAAAATTGMGVMRTSNLGRVKPSHDERIHAFCFVVDEPIEDRAFNLWLEVLMGFMGSNILRVKGILNIAGRDQPMAIHGVQHIFHPPVKLAGWPNADRRSKFIFITQDIPKEAIQSTFSAFMRAEYLPL